jgi:hypothetical protein
MGGESGFDAPTANRPNQSTGPRKQATENNRVAVPRETGTTDYNLGHTTFGVSLFSGPPLRAASFSTQRITELNYWFISYKTDSSDIKVQPRTNCNGKLRLFFTDHTRQPATPKAVVSCRHSCQTTRLVYLGAARSLKSGKSGLRQPGAASRCSGGFNRDV